MTCNSSCWLRLVVWRTSLLSPFIFWTGKRMKLVLSVNLLETSKLHYWTHLLTCVSQRFLLPLSQLHPSPTSSRSHMSWAGRNLVPCNHPSTQTPLWEERTSPWASGPVRVLLCCSMSTLSTNNTWSCSSMNMVRMYLFIFHILLSIWNLMAVNIPVQPSVYFILSFWFPVILGWLVFTGVLWIKICSLCICVSVSVISKWLLKPHILLQNQ